MEGPKDPLDKAKQGSTPRTAEIDIDDRVLHPKFGAGTVVDLEAGKRATSRIVVEFDNGIERKLPLGVFQRIDE